LVRRDHHDPEVGLEEHVDDRPVGTLDRDLVDASPMESGHQLPQPRRSVGDGEPVLLDTVGVDDGHSMPAAGPVDPRRRRGRRFGCRWGLVLVDHGVALLAVAAAGGHPQRFGTRLPVAH